MASNSTTLSDFAHSIFSYNSNIMLTALISLLLVVLFVLLLHAYANCFFPHPPRRRRRRLPSSSVTVSYVFGPPRLSRFDSVLFDFSSAPNSKGLDPSLVSAIPLFVYESRAAAMECVICLSEFEEREIGRRLPKCSHEFHLECIDMWLNSHANCPVCRAPVISEAADCSDAAESGRLSGQRETGGEIVMDQDQDQERNNCDQIQSSEGQNGQFHSSSSSSSVHPPLMSLGASLKRMLSRNRSEGRIFPSSNGDELDV